MNVLLLLLIALPIIYGELEDVSIYSFCHESGTGKGFCIGFKDNKHYFHGQGCMVSLDCEVLVAISKGVRGSNELIWILGAERNYDPTIGNIVQLVISKEKWYHTRIESWYIPFYELDSAGKSVMTTCIANFWRHDIAIYDMLEDPKADIITDSMSDQRLDVFNWKSKEKPWLLDESNHAWTTDFINDALFFNLRHSHKRGEEPIEFRNIVENVGLNESSGMRIWGQRFWLKDGESTTTEEPTENEPGGKKPTAKTQTGKSWLWPVVGVVVGIAVLTMVGAAIYLIIKHKQIAKEFKSNETQANDDEPIILFKNAKTTTTMYNE